MRLYKLLLYLYPASFRIDYGQEMAQLFAERRRHASGPIAVATLWIEALWDALASSLRVHGDILGQDLRTTWRGLRRAPGFALAAVTITALGIGANTAVFTLTDHVLVRPLPFAEPERLVKLWESPPGYSRMEPSPPNYLDWREQTASFESMGALYTTSVNLVGQGDPQRLAGAAVTAELFPVLGIQPQLGRFFNAEDTQEAAADSVVISHGLWQREFGGNPGILGQDIRLDDSTATVIGVMPRSFFFPRQATALWTPLRMVGEDFEDRDNNFFNVIARLKPEVSRDSASAEMDVIARRLEQQYPEEMEDTGATVTLLREDLSTQSRLLLAALFGASACVLLIACANLANLLLARALGRRKELAVRTAMGAGRERLLRQLLTESLVLAASGGVLGVLVAIGAVPLLEQLVPSSLPIGEATALDLRVLTFAAALTFVTGLGFGVVPALRLCRGDRLAGLMDGARSTTFSRRERLRAVLVTSEVAVSVVLLVSAGLLIRALLQVQAIDPGFRADNILTLRTPFPMTQYAATDARRQLYDRVLTEVRALPGVSSAAYISFVPMVMTGGIWPVTVDGQGDGATPARASLRFVTEGFFETLDIPLLAGRDVEDADTDERSSVAVVSESFVCSYWPEQDPLGRQFNFAFRDRTVVGVVGDIRVRGLERRSEPQVYLPHAQVPDGGLVFYAPRDLVIHAEGEAMSLLPAVRRIIREADPELPVADVRLLSEIVGAQTAPRQTQIRVLGTFAALALFLAGLGIYSLLAFAVSQRTSEIGLRMALGARSGDVLGMVLREGALLATVGSVLGLGAAYAAGRSLEALLVGVRPGDAMTFTVAVALALAMTLTGSLVPAIRASRVDPTTALRAE